MQYTYNMYAAKFCAISMSCISPESYMWNTDIWSWYRDLQPTETNDTIRSPPPFQQWSLGLGGAVADVPFRVKQIAVIHAELSPVRNLCISHHLLQVEVHDEGWKENQSMAINKYLEGSLISCTHIKTRVFLLGLWCLQQLDLRIVN